MINIENDIKFLKGVGEFKASQFRKMGIETPLDLMEYFPRAYIDRTLDKKISQLEIGSNVAIIGIIVNIGERPYGRGKKQLNITISDGSDILNCTWFMYSKWLIDKLKMGDKVWVSGVVSSFMSNYQIVHPDLEVLEGDKIENDFWKKRPLLPIYKLTGNMTNKYIRKLIVTCFTEYVDYIKEVLPQKIIKMLNLPDRREALQIMHFSTNQEKSERVRRRFVFEEFFYTQLLLGRTKFRQKKIVQGIKFELQHTYTKVLKDSLPFSLTSAQRRVINEIVEDMLSKKQMNRLIQGDVGSGKTIVTLFAMLLAIENGYQAIMMVPTEILAEQHYASISSYLDNQPEVNIALLKGGNYKGKKQVKEDIALGKYQIIVGTHALIQKDVEYSKPGFLVVDEQHRFGVEQRAKLSQKMNFPDMLFLSATPIPRSLAMTVFGDLDVSQIDELPPNRKPVVTRWHSESKKPLVYDEIRKEIEAGRQAYIVCPLVEESEKLDLIDAESLYTNLSENIFKKYRVGLIHGKMKTADKDEIMNSFKRGDFDILIATTVIEVGVDVGNASVMMIEHAERFGLSQLHQLRGRVGRGADKSYCYLISYPPISSEGRERLQTMVHTSDGFEIAEKDLEIRGPGDFFGKEQSGMPKFKFASLVNDQDILVTARKVAFKIIEEDPHLEAEENRIIKDYYYKNFFKREQLIRY